MFLRSLRWALPLLCLLVGCALPASDPTSTTPESKGTVVVGSKDFTEQYIIAEMYAQLLEQAGYQVERQLDLGPTPVLQEALEAGVIDLYPEYTGTGLLTVLELPSMSDPTAVYESVAQAYEERYGLIWLDPAPMNNTQALAMTREVAAAYEIESISDMAAKAGELILIGPPEFQSRPDGLPGLAEAYGDFQPKVYIPVEPEQRYQALLSDQGNVVVAFGTDGEIAAFDLVLLKDDRRFFPPYQVAPVVRGALLDEHPEVRELLNRLAPHLTNAAMQQLNYEVSGKERTPAEVAREFLLEIGLLE